MAKEKTKNVSRLKLDNFSKVGEEFSKSEIKERQWKNHLFRIDRYYYDQFQIMNNQYFIQSNNPKGYIHMANKFFLKAYEVFKSHMLEEMGLDKVPNIDTEAYEFLTRTGRRARYSFSEENETGEKKGIQLAFKPEVLKEIYSFIYVYYEHKEKRRNFHIYSPAYLLVEIVLWLQDDKKWNLLIDK